MGDIQPAYIFYGTRPSLHNLYSNLNGDFQATILVFPWYKARWVPSALPESLKSALYTSKPILPIIGQKRISWEMTGISCIVMSSHLWQRTRIVREKNIGRQYCRKKMFVLWPERRNWLPGNDAKNDISFVPICDIQSILDDLNLKSPVRYTQCRTRISLWVKNRMETTSVGKFYFAINETSYLASKNGEYSNKNIR